MIYIEFRVCFGILIRIDEEYEGMKRGIWLFISIASMVLLSTAHAESNRHQLKIERFLAASSASKSTSPKLRSNIVLIFDKENQKALYNKNDDVIAPIASITKLMTAMVVLDANLPLNEELSVSPADIDMLKGTHSRLRIGMTFTRSEMLKLALMASENRAASSLARNYPGGREALVMAMNIKARELGMVNTRFLDATGLNSGNVSTAKDLVKMVDAASEYALIHQYTTSATHSLDGWGGREMRFNNTNPLVRNASWDIGVSKTGYINEAGRCLVMEATINDRQVIIVLLDSVGKRTRVGDANRIKKWMESEFVHNT